MLTGHNLKRDIDQVSIPHQTLSRFGLRETQHQSLRCIVCGKEVGTTQEYHETD